MGSFSKVEFTFQPNDGGIFKDVIDISGFVTVVDYTPEKNPGYAPEFFVDLCLPAAAGDKQVRITTNLKMHAAEYKPYGPKDREGPFALLLINGEYAYCNLLRLFADASRRAHELTIPDFKGFIDVLLKRAAEKSVDGIFRAPISKDGEDVLFICGNAQYRMKRYLFVRDLSIGDNYTHVVIDHKNKHFDLE